MGEEDLLRRVVEACAAAPLWGFDTEGTGLDTRGHDRDTGDVTCGYCLSPAYGYGFYVPFAHSSGSLAGLYPGQMPLETILEILGPLLRTPGRMVCHNTEYEYRMLRKDGIEIVPAHDTLIAIRLVAWGTGRFDAKGDDGGAGLDALVGPLLGHETLKFTDLFPPPPAGKKRVKQTLNFATLDPFDPRVVAYAGSDASNTLGIWPRALALMKQSNLETVYEIERNLMPAVFDMKATGICIDGDLAVSKAREGREVAAEVSAAYHAEIKDVLGRELTVNLDSAPQLQKLFFEQPPDGLGLPVLARSKKTGKPSTNKAVLKALADQYPVVRRIQTYRALTKQLGTYLEGFPTHICEGTGRIHPDFGALKTETGRFACSNPNVQNTPREGMDFDLGDGRRYVANVRDVIVAPPGCYLFSADYSQVEYRAMAGEAGETSLLEAFARGWDVHQATASMIFNLEMDAVTKQHRYRGKTQNFSLLYGQEPPATAAALGITVEEARAMQETYFAKLPAIKAWIERTHEESRRRGYGMTKWGRRCYLPEFSHHLEGVRKAGDRQAVSVAIQGSCADVLKLSMIRWYRRAREAGLYHRIRLIMTVHDSLVFEVDEAIPIEQVYALVHECMAGLVIPGWPALAIDCEAGFRYGSLVKYDPEKPFAWPGRESTPPPPPDEEDPVLTADDPADTSPPEGSLPAVVSLAVGSITASQLTGLDALLRSNPGPNEVELAVAGQVFSLAPRTSLSPDSHEWLTLFNGNRPRVAWRSDDDPLAGISYHS